MGTNNNANNTVNPGSLWLTLDCVILFVYIHAKSLFSDNINEHMKLSLIYDFIRLEITEVELKLPVEA